MSYGPDAAMVTRSLPQSVKKVRKRLGRQTGVGQAHPVTGGEPPVCYNRSRATRRSATRMNTQLSTAACVVLSPTPTAPLPV